MGGGLRDTRIALKCGRSCEELEHETWPILERLRDGLRALKQKEAGVLAGVARGQLGYRANTGRTGIVEHG